MVLSTVAVGVAAHNADRIASGSLARALIVNGANLLTYACIWTARYFIFNRYLFGARTQVHAQEQPATRLLRSRSRPPVTPTRSSPGFPRWQPARRIDPVADVL